MPPVPDAALSAEGRIVFGVALALYRKYRPATFGEVVGQTHVTKPLRTALAAGRINHAYLFSGPRGCGKTSSARILARSLNCVRGPTDEPCGECDSCVALAPEGPGSVDVIELDAASHGGVDDTRELRDRAVFAPAQSRYRIFVIDEAHMVTPQGFNALLKIVEEPPEHLVFVFATTEPDKVLTTIKSRTHHYPFRLIPPGELRGLLERICDEEGVKVEPAVYPLAIRAGGGSARDSLSILDQLLAGADERGVTYERAVALLGVTDVALIDEMVDALAAGDFSAVYGTVDRLVEAGHDPRRFASDLLDRLRDLVLLHSVPDAAERGLIEAAGDETIKMQTQAEQLGAATLTRFAEIVHAGLSEMRGATAPRLLLELLCSRMMLPAVSSDESALLQRLEQVERRMTVAPPVDRTTATSESSPTTGPARAANAQSEPERLPEPERPVEPEAPQGPPQPRSETPPAPPADPGSAPAGRQPDRRDQSSPASNPPGQHTEGVAQSSAGSNTSTEMDAAGLRQVWNELLRAVAERNRPTQALLLNATVQDLRDGVLVLSMPTSGLRKQFAQPHRVDFVRDAMRAVLGGEWQVECVEAGGEPAKPARGKEASQASTTQPAGNERPAEPEHDRGGRAGAEHPSTGGNSRPPDADTAGNAAPGNAGPSPAAGGERADSTVPEASGFTESFEERAAREPAAVEPPVADEVPPPPEPPDEDEPAADPSEAEAPDRARQQRPEPVGTQPASGAEAEESNTSKVSSADNGVTNASGNPRPEVATGDAEQDALDLLASELGARPIEDR